MSMIRPAVCAALAATAFCAPAYALKYAAPEHNLTVDSRIPGWQPGNVPIKPPEEETTAPRARS